MKLARIRTRLSPDEVVARLRAAAKQGRLAGFEAGSGEVLFRATLFGEPFDRRLEAVTEPGGEGTTLRFRSRLALRLPIVFGVVIALTIWPGVWITDSMLGTYSAWYGRHFGVWETCLWYLPLTVIPLPWALRRMIRKSETACAASAVEVVEKIRVELGAEIVAPSAGGA